MGGRGSSSKGNTSNVSSISDAEYGLLESSSQYGVEMSENPDSFAYEYGSIYGLNKNEVNLIHSYTADLFEKLNNDIREGKGGITEFAKSKLNRALEKLPSVNGTVYRGINVGNPSAFAKNLKKSGSFEFGSFTSTSSDIGVIKTFAKKNKGIIFEIKTKRGKDISRLSTEKKEKEVLLKAGSKFKYKGQRESDGFIYINIVEI